MTISQMRELERQATVIEEAKKMYSKQDMIGFHKWMKENDTPENAEQYFHYTDEDMLEEYLNRDKRLPKEVRNWLNKL